MDKFTSNKPKFSIIIPTYSAEILLSECIRSLCNQSVEKDSFEVIVINDGGSREIGNKLGLFENQINIRYFYQGNKGPAAARNLGIKKARGNIILFLDDDSLPTSIWLKAVNNAWETYPDYDGIGGYIVSKKSDSIFCRVNTDFFNWYLAHYSANENYPFLTTCNAGYKKSVLNKVGNFDEEFKKASGEDRDLNIKVIQAGGKLRLEKSILVYHDRDLTLLSYIKKYNNYGKAAKIIYTRYPELKRLSSSSYLNLYVSVLKNYPTYREKLMALFLVTLSQVFTILGYHSTMD